MKKKLLALTMAGTIALTCFSGCGSSKEEDVQKSGVSKEDEEEGVALTVWGAEDDQVMLGEMIESFQKEYTEVAGWNIKLSMESEKDAKDDVLNDPEMAGDLFAFADDQFDDFLKMMIHDYLSVDHPYTNRTTDFVAKVETEVA